MFSFKNTFAAVAVTAVAALATAGMAQAVPLTGTFGVSVYQGVGSGAELDPIELADPANPLIAGGALATGTYTGAINFNPGTNTVGAFFASGGGTTTGLSGVAGNELSAAGFGQTTLLVITGDIAGGGISGFVRHDDGASLYQGSSLVFNSQDPTSAIDTAYSDVTGPFTLYYVEANGLPAVLQFQVNSVPEPSSLAIMGAGLGLLGLFGVTRRRRNKA